MKQLEMIELQKVYKFAYEKLPQEKKDEYKKSCLDKEYRKKDETKDYKETYGNDYEEKDVFATESECVIAYRKNNYKKLLESCKILGINLSEIETSNDTDANRNQNIKIPVILAPLLITLLRAESKKGSLVNLIKVSKSENITKEQKEEFLKIYAEELSRAKTYSTITDDIIDELCEGLKNDIETLEHTKNYVHRLEEQVLNVIKRDIYSLYKVNPLTGIALPNMFYIKALLSNSLSEILQYPHCSLESSNICGYNLCKERKRVNIDSCDKCDYKDNCLKCSKYEECESMYKPDCRFSDVGYLEQKYFTRIYIDMLTKARQRFLEFISDYNDITNERVYSGDIRYDDETIRSSINELLLDCEYSEYVYSKTLKTLKNESKEKDV